MPRHPGNSQAPPTEDDVSGRGRAWFRGPHAGAHWRPQALLQPAPNVRREDALAAEAEPDDPSNQAPGGRQATHHAQDRCGWSEEITIEASRRRGLERLHAPRGPFAPTLHRRQIVVSKGAPAQRLGQQVGGRDSVSDREIDSDRASRRHRVSRVADAKQTWLVPPKQPIRTHVEQFDLVPIAEASEGCDKKRRRQRNPVPEGVQALFPEGRQRSLRNDHPALPVVPTIDHDHELAAAHRAKAAAITFSSRKPEPEHVHRHPKRPQREARAIAKHRGPAIAGDDQRGLDLEVTRGCGSADARHATTLAQQVLRLTTHLKVEGRVPACPPAQKVEEVPLRHHGQELAARREVPEVNQLVGRPIDPQLELIDLGVRQPQELVEQIEVGQDVGGGGMNRVAAEISEEVRVLLQHHHLHAGTDEQKREHDPGRSASDHAATGTAAGCRTHGDLATSEMFRSIRTHYWAAAAPPKDPHWRAAAPATCSSPVPEAHQAPAASGLRGSGLTAGSRRTPNPRAPFLRLATPRESVLHEIRCRSQLI